MEIKGKWWILKPFLLFTNCCVHIVCINLIILKVKSVQAVSWDYISTFHEFI